MSFADLMQLRLGGDALGCAAVPCGLQTQQRSLGLPDTKAGTQQGRTRGLALIAALCTCRLRCALQTWLQRAPI